MLIAVCRFTRPQRTREANVVLILMDDMGTAISPFNPEAKNRTPHLADGQGGDEADLVYACPVCTPSRRSSDRLLREALTQAVISFAPVG